MSEHDPVLMRRLLELRRFPLFAGAELAELATLAENVVEVAYPSGAVIAGPEPVDALHLILSGQIHAGAARFGEREAFGWLEVLARRPPAAMGVTVGEARTLRLAASDLGELLEDNFGLLALALRELAGRTLAIRGPAALTRRAAAPSAPPLGLVDRMIVLRQGPPFASARLEALAILAHESKEITWAPGDLVCRLGAPVRAAYFLLEGSVRATPAEHAPSLLGPGAVIGVLESLAGLRSTSLLEVAAPARALEISSTVIFDVLEDHPELGLAMLETLAGGLLEATASAELRAS